MAEISGDIEIFLYTIYGIVSQPLVLRSIGNDVYFVLQQTEAIYQAISHTMGGIPITPSVFVVRIMVFPLMNILWLGTLLMSIGIITPILEAFTPRKTC